MAQIFSIMRKKMQTTINSGLSIEKRIIFDKGKKMLAAVPLKKDKTFLTSVSSASIFILFKRKGAKTGRRKGVKKIMG